MSYAQLVAADMRLVILTALAEDADYANNEHVLRAMLGSVGHAVSADRLRTELHWLHEQGLLSIDDVAGMHVAKLNQRGVDVARGFAVVPGVRRPGPGGY